MNKKIIAIISAVALVVIIVVVATFAACGGNNNGGEETTTDDNKVELPSGSEGSEDGSDKDPEPEDLTFTDCAEQDVYVLHQNGAVNLRSNPDYTSESVAVSVNNGTKLTKIAESSNGEWTKVVYEENTYYIASKCLTTFADLDEGFVACEKTLIKGEGSLNIRIEPAMSDKDILGHYSEGDEVKVVAENTTTGWYKVEFENANGDTIFGYIANDAKYFVNNEEETSSETESDTESESETEPKTEAAGK